MKHLIFIILLLPLCLIAQNVGIGTTAPSQKLDVNGNLKISGALMPANDPGTSGQLLMSGGAGAPPTWSSPLLNPGSTSGFGKFYVLITTINANSDMELTVTDPNCTPDASISVSLTSASGTLPFSSSLERSNLVINNIEAQNGQFIVSITNFNSFIYSNFQIAYVAFY